MAKKGMVGGDTIRIEGLRELSRALKAVQAGTQKEIAQVFKSAAEKVATTARSRINSRSGKLADSIRPYGTQRAAGVRMGKQSVPYAGPYEFGGYPAGRPFIKEGRAIYPTFQEQEPIVRKDIEKGLREIIFRNGLS
jgi:hypothetical protein